VLLVMRLLGNIHILPGGYFVIKLVSFW